MVLTATPSANTATRVDDPLTEVLNLLVPADEDPVDRANRLALERDALRVSAEIEERLRIESLEEKNRRIIKVLLLGQNESEKSRMLKNIQRHHAPSSFQMEACAWRAIIHLTLLRSINMIAKALLQASRENAPSIIEELRPLLVRLAPLREAEGRLRVEMSLIQEKGDSGVLRTDSGSFVVRSASTWKDAFCKWREGINRNDSVEWNNQAERVLEACAEDMTTLWTNQATKEMIGQSRVHIEESEEAFLNNIERIAKKAYQPTDEDILQARIPTVGPQGHRIRFETGKERVQDWYFYDMKVPRSRSSAWEAFFDEVDAIVFLAPLGSFDQALPEDSHLNRLEYSLLSWKSICSSRTLAKIELILVLSECDLLAKKLDAGIRLAKYIPSFGDHPNTLDVAAKFLRGKFRAIHKHYSLSPRTFHCQLTSARDVRSSAMIVAGVQELITRSHLQATKIF